MQSATMQTTTNATHYYQSLAHYDHKVFKCAGLVHADDNEHQWWSDYLKTNSALAANRTARPQAFEVVELPYMGDRITRNADGDWVEFTQLH